MTLREIAKRDWSGPELIEEIQAGALQRIADATEQMAANWTALTAERDRYRHLYHEQLGRCSGRDRTISALRGVITKLKKGAR